MFINLEKAKNEFINYTNNYDSNDDMIELKISHSLRVMEFAKNIATQMNLNEEDIEIAAIIGLLHDIGRFDQQTIYKTYSDLNSFDHGDYAVEILDRDIRKYIEDDKYDDIILKAIKNHNKFQIEEGLTDKELLFAKIIRDADKLDILYQSTYRFWSGKEELVNNSDIYDDVLTSINNEHLIKKDKKYENINSVLFTVCYVFDINFKESFKILKQENYINKIFDRFNYKDPQLISNINNKINSYIDKQI